MLMSVSIVNITNISQQVINILYSQIAQNLSASAYVYTSAGQIGIQPGKSTAIEADRVDLGQLKALSNKGLITTTTS
jgi:hypothetical protein